jgi:hypothetical protein
VTHFTLVIILAAVLAVAETRLHLPPSVWRRDAAASFLTVASAAGYLNVFSINWRKSSKWQH